MNLYVLDTDHVSLFQRGHPGVTEKVLATNPEYLAITVITVEEQLRGRLNQVRKMHFGSALVNAYARLTETLRYFARINILHYSTEADIRYQSLRQHRISIGTQDLRIASITLSTGATLVTRNQSDFGRIPNLALEDWSQS